MLFPKEYAGRYASVKADFGYGITESKTFYAGWRQTTVTVTFDPNREGGEPTAVPVTIGSAVAQPQDPVWDDAHLFTGWFTDEDCSVRYDFTAPVTEALTLYAGWEEADLSDTVLVTFSYNFDGAPNGGVWYETYQELAEAFVMPGADTTVRAVYAEDFAIAFTPSCRTEDKNLGTVYNMEHVSVADGVMGTRYKMEAGGPTYVKITNGSLESHGEADGVCNTCPLSEDNKSSLLMTFTNNGETAITLRYETEFRGVRGSVTVEPEAGESATVLLVSSPTPAGTGDSNAPFHQMEITSGGEAGYDVTVSGFRVV